MIGLDRPRTRPSHVIGDKGYSSKAIRGCLRRRCRPRIGPGVRPVRSGEGLRGLPGKEASEAVG